MELADDISYGVHDLEDVLSLQLVTFRQWEDEIIKKLPPKSEDAVSKEVDFVSTINSRAACNIEEII
jgi:dGTPase